VTNAATTPHVGSLLGERYELLRHIARGGMGDVYEGVDRVLERPVAVKVFRSASPADRVRFDAEVRVLAGLGHHGLVRVYDAGPHGDDAYVVLELIDGPPLSRAMEERGPIPPEEVARLGAEVADALAYIHANGVVHRDVTPANVLCDPSGRPRLVDFGIARLLDSPRITTTSLTVGTVSYMAPEQLHGSEVTPSADVYSLGLVLLEALTGRRAFDGTVQETAIARLARAPEIPSEVPGAWRALLTEMTQPDPAHRPSSADVRDRLAALEVAADEPTAPVAAFEGTTEPVAALGVDAPTQVLAATGATAIMAAPVLEPIDLPPPGNPRRSWAPVWIVAAASAALVAVVALVASADGGGGGGGVETPPASTTPASVADEADTDTPVTDPPTTTLAPTTVPETVPPETTLAPQDGFPFDPDEGPPGLDPDNPNGNDGE
jgi:serine/threonine protein kinase